MYDESEDDVQTYFINVADHSVQENALDELMNKGKGKVDDRGKDKVEEYCMLWQTKPVQPDVLCEIVLVFKSMTAKRKRPEGWVGGGTMTDPLVYEHGATWSYGKSDRDDQREIKMAQGGFDSLKKKPKSCFILPSDEAKEYDVFLQQSFTMRSETASSTPVLALVYDIDESEVSYVIKAFTTILTKGDAYREAFADPQP